MEENNINRDIVNSKKEKNLVKTEVPAYNQVLVPEETRNVYENENVRLIELDRENEKESDSEEGLNVDSKKKYFCSFKDCNATFLKPSRILQHKRQHTGERPYKCNVKSCDKAYTNSSHLKRHLKTHSNKKQTYVCPHCPTKISFLHNLKRHFERMHSDKNDKMVCKDCGKFFRKSHSFHEHLAAHNNSSITYKCVNCGLSFINHSKFKKHQKSHDNTGFKCKKCKIFFELREEYKNHLKSVHKNDHVCSVCKKYFTRKMYLEKHQLMHCNENIYTCHYKNCCRIYYHKRNLNDHIRTAHLGRRFTCDICNAQYTSKRRLKLHIYKIHLGNDLERRKDKNPKTRKERKDKGVPKKSMVSRLIGVEFPCDVENKILNRSSVNAMIK